MRALKLVLLAVALAVAAAGLLVVGYIWTHPCWNAGVNHSECVENHQ